MIELNKVINLSLVIYNLFFSDCSLRIRSLNLLFILPISKLCFSYQKSTWISARYLLGIFIYLYYVNSRCVRCQKSSINLWNMNVIVPRGCGFKPIHRATGSAIFIIFIYYYIFILSTTLNLTLLFRDHHQLTLVWVLFWCIILTSSASTKSYYSP